MGSLLELCAQLPDWTTWVYAFSSKVVHIILMCSKFVNEQDTQASLDPDSAKHLILHWNPFLSNKASKPINHHSSVFCWRGVDKQIVKYFAELGSHNSNFVSKVTSYQNQPLPPKLASATAEIYFHLILWDMEKFLFLYLSLWSSGEREDLLGW